VSPEDLKARAATVIEAIRTHLLKKVLSKWRGYRTSTRSDSFHDRRV